MKIVSVFGTRPEAIKMASVVKEIQRREELHGIVCISSQQREMLQGVLDVFDIQPDYDLAVQRKTFSLSELTAQILTNLDAVLETSKPDMLLVHGDTSTTLAAALAAFHRQIPIGHVEAGLRTGNLASPWPEEGNRRAVGALASLHFAPTQDAADNLLAENIPASRIFVTGNTVIDSLLMTRGKIQTTPGLLQQLAEKYPFLQPGRSLVLVTAHRRENFGAGFERICAALRNIAQRHPDTDIVYPVHLNPNVLGPVHRLLSNIPNVHLIEPQEYFPFVYLMDRADVLLTDSGGIQEEAPSLGKPVLVMRDTTERPEAVQAGTVVLVGTDAARIEQETSRLLNDPVARTRASSRRNPYGDGHAAEHIVDTLCSWHRQSAI